MKKQWVFLLAMVLCVMLSLTGWAENVPANPGQKTHGTVSYTTVQPTAAPMENARTIFAQEGIVAPAMFINMGAVDVMNEQDMLTKEMVKQLDGEVQDLLEHSGELINTVKGTKNILLIGLDARPGETRSRSDTMMIITIDGDDGQIRLTSLMRDLYVNIPGRGNNRMNAAYVYGGADLLMQTIEDNFGLHIDDYVAVDLQLVIEAVDDVGGLVLNVESQKQLRAINGVIDAYNAQFRCPVNSDLLTKTGEQLMNGKQVQAYARYRKIDSDFYRTQRQREVISKLYKKVSEQSIVDLTLMASRYISRVDTSMNLIDIVSLLPDVMNMRSAEIEQLRLPTDGDYQSRTINGMQVLVPDLTECRKKLDAFING